MSSPNYSIACLQLGLVAALLLGGGQTSAGMPDPTAPPAQVQPAQLNSTSAPQLQALLVSGQRRVAVIDAVLLQEGQSSDRVRVLAIGADTVDVVELNTGRQLQLQLPATRTVKEQSKP